MSDEDEQLLVVMSEALGRIAVYIDGYDLEGFETDQRTIDAVALNLLVAGECSIQLSDALKAAIAAPWPRIAGLRHRIAHGYQSLSTERLWETAAVNAPELRLLVLGRLERP